MKGVMAFAVAAVLATFAVPHPVQAADGAQANCAQPDADLPPPLAAWAQAPASMAAAVSPEKLSAAIVPIGKKVAVTLAPSSSVSQIAPPEKALQSDDPHAGLLALRVSADGRYRIILGKNAWIDVVVAGKTVPSVAFGDSPKCSTIRKFVVFSLKAGDATVQLSGASSGDIDVLVAREP